MSPQRVAGLTADMVTYTSPTAYGHRFFLAPFWLYERAVMRPPPALRRPLPDVDGDVERVVVRPPPVAFVHASNVYSESSTTPERAKFSLPSTFSLNVVVTDLVPEWMCDGIWPTLIFFEPPTAPAAAYPAVPAHASTPPVSFTHVPPKTVFGSSEPTVR